MLYLWRTLPLPEWLRWIIVSRGNARFAAGASAFVCDEQGRVLLFEHTYRPRHAWGLPGGWMKRGEHPDETVVREMREEGGFEIVVERLCLVDIDPRRPHLDFVYACRIVGGAFRPSAEVRGYAYVDPAHLPDVFPRQREHITKCLVASDEWLVRGASRH